MEVARASGDGDALLRGRMAASSRFWRAGRQDGGILGRGGSEGRMRAVELAEGDDSGSNRAERTEVSFAEREGRVADGILNEGGALVVAFVGVRRCDGRGREREGSGMFGGWGGCFG